MMRKNLRNVATATATFACVSLLSFGWSAQRGISLSVESAQAQIARPYWRASHGYGVDLAPGPWVYNGGSPCDYERTGGGYYRGAGWDRYLLWGTGAYCRAAPL